MKGKIISEEDCFLLLEVIDKDLKERKMTQIREELSQIQRLRPTKVSFFQVKINQRWEP